MTRGAPTYTSDRAVEVLRQIETVLNDRGGASTVDLMEVTGLSTNRVGEFLREMRRRGTAVCVQRASKYQGGTVPAQWGPGERSADLDEKDDAPRTVIVRKEWEPNHCRMALDCYLFGMPTIGAAA